MLRISLDAKMKCSMSKALRKRRKAYVFKSLNKKKEFLQLQKPQQKKKEFLDLQKPQQKEGFPTSSILVPISPCIVVVLGYRVFAHLYDCNIS